MAKLNRQYNRQHKCEKCEDIGWHWGWHQDMGSIKYLCDCQIEEKQPEYQYLDEKQW